MFKDILPNKYFEHYVLLVGSIHILMSDDISDFDIQLAECCLNHFYIQFSDLYGN